MYLAMFLILTICHLGGKALQTNVVDNYKTRTNVIHPTQSTDRKQTKFKCFSK